MKLIWGKNIALRRFEERMSEAEIDRLYRWSRDEEVLRWSGGSPTDLGQDEFREHLRGERLYGPSNRRQFLIFIRAPFELIGRLGVYGIDWDKREGELGIVIGEKQYWGYGYGREAIRTLAQHLFASSSLHRIYLYTFIDNYRAQKSFAAAGFRVVDRGRRFTPDTGEFDGVQMEITRVDFLEQQFGAKKTCTPGSEK